MNKIPYIIVDNVKIPPLQRSPRPETTTQENRGTQESPFGIVDRVTLSREGLEKSRQQQDIMAAQSSALDRPATTNAPMLTYSPKMQR